MPCFDMPLEELKTYMGSSPRPDDFDEYWARAKAEMESVYAPAELIPSDFTTSFADCYDMYFTGVGGARVHAKVIIPKDLKEPAPCVCFYHGYYGRVDDWTHFLHWPAQGYVFAGLDCRGQAGLSEDVGGVKGNTIFGQIIRGLEDPNPDALLFRSIFLDCAQMAKYMFDMDIVDKTKVYTDGGSQGGALSLATAALEPRIAKTAAEFPFLCDYRRVWDMDLTTEPYAELRRYFRWRDPVHAGAEAAFRKLGYIDIQNHAPNIKAKVLMFTGLMDQICPASTQFAAYNKMTCEKNMIIYPDFGHEGLPGCGDYTFRFFAE
ncbi:MAG: acetylxylan esterase [Abditibacteriota bacterium]|nr:acetylxylan esterase [Abditibacteriota bacterium]